MPSFRTPLTRRLLLAGAATALTLAAPAQAANTETMLKTATEACINRAAETGYRADLTKVLSSKVLDADKVQVVLDLTKDGSSHDRLTCPYSVKEGLIGNFAKLSLPGVPNAASPLTRNCLWWLLLPIGAALLGYSVLRGRDQARGSGAFGSGIAVIADGPGGDLAVREHADGGSSVLRRERNGDTVHLSGRRQGDWVEVVNGGWVLDRELRYDRTNVRFN